MLKWIEPGGAAAEVVKAHPDALVHMKALASQSPNVIVSDDPIASPLPSGLDAVFIRQNYHDLYDKFMGPADVPAFNSFCFASRSRIDGKSELAA